MVGSYTKEAEWRPKVKLPGSVLAAQKMEALALEVETNYKEEMMGTAGVDAVVVEKVEEMDGNVDVEVENAIAMQTKEVKETKEAEAIVQSLSAQEDVLV